MAFPPRTPDLGGYNAGAQSTGTTNAPPATDPAAIKKALNPVQLTSDEIQAWWDRIDKSQKRREAREDKWDILLKEYLPVVREESEDPKVNGHFRNVHTKLGQLFVRSPDVICMPKGPTLETQTVPGPMGPVVLSPADVVAVKQAVINEHMGPDFIDGLRLMDECAFDIMAWAGLCFVKVAYRVVHKPLQQEAAPVEPGMPAPPPQTIPVPIFEEWVADRISPKKGLLDELLKSCRHAKDSRWIGHEFFLDKKLVMREYGLTEDEAQAGTEDDRVYKHEDDQANQSGPTSKDLVHGYEIYYFCSKFRDDQPHPQAVYQLVLFEGMKDKTAVSRPSPDQTFDAQGKLTPDSLVGLPILVGVIRDVADSPYPPADSAFTNVQVKGMNTFRQQSYKLRDAQIDKYLYDAEKLDDDDKAKIQNGEVGDMIAVKGGTLDGGVDKVMTPLNRVKSTPEDWKLDAMLRRDMDETLGISSVQAGSPLETVRSATEISETTTAAAGRQEKEQSRMVAFYIQIVRAVDTLLQRYFTGQDYAEIEGQSGARLIVQYNQQVLQGKYAYDIKPDSQLRIDAARDRQQKLSLYNLTAKDPIVKRAPVLRDLFREFGYDPNKTVMTDQELAQQQQAQQMAQAAAAGQPPQPGAPSFPAAVAQPPHGGPVNKHQLENSGQPSQGRAPATGRVGGTAGDNRAERNPQEVH